MKIQKFCSGLFLLFLFSCASGPYQRKTTQGLYGMIYDRENKPVNEVKIYEDTRLKAVSDIHGHFSLGNLKPGKEYHIRAYKEDYEAITVTISFTDPKKVLYISMYNTEQLLSEAEQALRDKNWIKAESFLKRAEGIRGDYLSIHFLRGVLAFCQGKHEEALNILTDLADKEKNSPYLQLFIADLYQYRMGNTDQAMTYLNRFLESRYDPEIQERVRELEGGQKAL
jgi:tetratricopeptide (TPR) repeat protein